MSAATPVRSWPPGIGAPPAPIFEDWWRGWRLAPDGASGWRDLRRWASTATGDAGDLPSLLQKAAGQDLLQRLGPAFAQVLSESLEPWSVGLVCAAAVLSLVTEDAPGAAGAAFRQGSRHAGAPALAEARVLTLLRQSSGPGLLRHGRQAVRLLGGHAPVGALGAGLLLWFEGRVSSIEWAADYYGLPAEARGPLGAAETVGRLARSE